jgi:hypothetical protein
MCLAKVIQSFLQHRLAINSMSRFTFSKPSGIPYQTIIDISHSNTSMPSLFTIIRVADFFQCSIDEIVGRDKYIVYKKDGCEFNKLQPTDVSNNLKRFINSKIHLLSISPYALGLDLGFSKNALTKFLKENSSKYSINSRMIISLANYFDISIDVMIGRINN